MNQYLDVMVKQAGEDNKKWFPEVADDLVHHVLSLAGEVGEVANILKKADRDRRGMTEEEWNAITEEVVDVFTYVLSISAILNFDLDGRYTMKRLKNKERFEK